MDYLGGPNAISEFCHVITRESEPEKGKQIRTGVGLRAPSQKMQGLLDAAGKVTDSFREPLERTHPCGPSWNPEPQISKVMCMLS